MKKDIHPDYVTDPGDLHLWRPVHDPEHRRVGRHPLRRVLAVPPVLHRQAEDPRHRWSRGPLRGSLRQEGRCREEVVLLDPGTHPRTRKEASVFEAVDALVAEHAALEGRLAEPETHADQRLAKRLNQRYAELTAVVASYREWLQLGDDIAAARELAGEDAAFAAEADELGDAARRRRGAAAAPAGAARPHRRQGRAAGGQVGGGRRGVGAVRRRPAAHVHPLRRAARLEDRGARRHRVRPRRLQERHPRREGEGHVRRRARRRTACSSSRAACTACSGCRSPSPRAACTPRPPGCW